MAGDISTHLHKAAAESAKSFPANDDEIKEALRMVQESRQNSAASAKRLGVRFECPGEIGVATVMHPGGSLAANEIVMLDLSEGGCGFLYPGFIHSKSECVIHMKAIDGTTVMIPGQTVWCRFVTQSLHAIGVAWTDPIDVRRFIPSRLWLEQAASQDDVTSKELKGKLLVVGFEPLELGMLDVYLEDTSIEITDVPDSGATHDQAALESYDFIMIDAENESSRIEELVKELRDDGCNEPIIIVSQRESLPDGLKDIKSLTLLHRPYSKEIFLATIRDLLFTNTNPLVGTRPIVTTLPPEKAKVVSVYIENLKKYRDQIDSAVATDNTECVLKIVNSIRNTASGFGFPLLEEAAVQVTTAVNASGSAAEASSAIRVLTRLIGRLDAHGPRRESA